MTSTLLKSVNNVRLKVSLKCTLNHFFNKLFRFLKKCTYFDVLTNILKHM